MEFAMCMTGVHPGQEDRTKGIPVNNGKAQVLGRDSDHIADPLWRTLAYPGAFWVIRDGSSGEVRPLEVSRKYCRIRQKDLKRRREWLPSPPILSPDQIDGEPVWTHRGRGLPKQVRFKSGWEASFFTNEGKVKQGNRLHLAWFDEEVSSAHWYRETMRGLMDWDGIFWWSATPQTGSVALYDLHQKGLEGGAGAPEEFFLHIQDNPYITQEAKDEFRQSLLTEDDIRVSWDGEYLMTGLVVYPELDCEHSNGVHFCRWERDNPPLDWMKVVITDPGYRVCASLFAALSPKGDIHVYDELYLKGKNANQWAPEVVKKLRRPNGFQEQPGKHVFDFQFGRVTQPGSGETVMQQYMDALARVGVRHHANTAPYFSRGQKDVHARTESTKNLLSPDPHGRVKIKVDAKRCPNLVREMKLQRWKLTGRDKRASVDDHLVDCFEYLCAYPLRYVPPIVSGVGGTDPEENPIIRALEEKRKRQRGVPGALSLREVMRLRSPLNEEEYSDAYTHPDER